MADLRWKAPVIRDNYNGQSLDCTEEGASCTITSEDCLFITVHVAKSVMQSNQKVPVVFYIHGGALQDGDNRIDLRNMVKDQGTDQKFRFVLKTGIKKTYIHNGF